MDVKDFMPDEAAIAGIKADLERYEAERSRTRWAVRWRVVLFQGLLLAAILALALLFNRFADPNEQWHSAPHLMLYVVGFIAAIGIQIAATSPARRLQQSFRDRIIPLIFGFIDRVDYRHAETPGSFHRLPREAVGSFNNEQFDDVISGRYEGSHFELYEATLFQKSGKSLERCFQGCGGFLRRNHAVSGASGGDAQVEQVGRFPARPVRRSSSRSYRAAWRRSTRNMISAPTMSRRRARW